jgi:putative thymidine phosphorylase
MNHDVATLAPGQDGAQRAPVLRLRRVGIDTYQELVVYMRADCHVCRAEGFESHSRVRLSVEGRSIIATLNVVSGNWLERDEAGLSEAAWQMLHAMPGQTTTASHPDPLESFSHVRAKVYGHTLTADSIAAIVTDVAAGRYSALEMAAFVAACAGDKLSLDETTALTRSMVDAGQRLHWGNRVVVNKHCVGGLPGNRTTPIVVAIAAACGLVIPKTSSRSITSPAGTADTMEMLTPVNLDLQHMRRVVEREGGCLVWGGAMDLSPADDILIRVERPLDFDSEGQLTASVLSKNLAAGSTHLVVDIPVGPTAKVRTPRAAEKLSRQMREVGDALGITVETMLTDGSQPVGRGIGPALEAHDVLAVLQNRCNGATHLRDRAVDLAGNLLELAGHVSHGEGPLLARETLLSGAAWRKFVAICEAQGGLREPPVAAYRRDFLALSDGVVRRMDNRRLSRFAKLAGAPRSPAAGIELHCRIGSRVTRGDALFTVHAETPGELAYASSYAALHTDVIDVEAMP